MLAVNLRKGAGETGDNSACQPTVWMLESPILPSLFQHRDISSDACSVLCQPHHPQDVCGQLVR